MTDLNKILEEQIYVEEVDGVHVVQAFGYTLDFSAQKETCEAVAKQMRENAAVTLRGGKLNVVDEETMRNGKRMMIFIGILLTIAAVVYFFFGIGR